MDETIERMSHSIGETFERKSRRFSSVSKFIKWALVVGSTITSSMHFVAEKWPPAPYIGVVAAFVVMLAAIFFIWIDEDSSRELELARQAIEKAKQVERKCSLLFAEYDDLNKAQIRRNELYVSAISMKNAIESSIRVDSANADSVAQLIISQSARSLRLACGFEAHNHHTISIYKSRACKRGSQHSKELYLVATDRSIECPLNLARVFPAGIGVTGISFSTNKEIFNEDASIPSAVALPDDLQKEQDINFHSSIVAVPIRIRGETSPWGVVTLTSSVARHFCKDEHGLQSAEPARAIAGMMGLAVTALALRPKAS